MGAIAGVPQPFPYQGSKRLLAEHVLSWLPHKFDRLIEPFAGSAAIYLAAAKTGRTVRFWISDANEPLVDLWKAIVQTPEDLASKYEALWKEQQGNERAYFDLIRDRFNETHRPEHFLYLLARCVKAAIRYNSQGKFNNSPDNRRIGRRPDKMRTNLGPSTTATLLGRNETTFESLYLSPALLDALGGNR